MSDAIRTAEEQFKKTLKGIKGVSVSRRKPAKFTEAQKKQIRQMNKELKQKGVK
jgi:hypothetical protein